MGPYHPECPDRLHAINDRLIAAGLDIYLRHYTAPAATHEQLARVHGEGYIATLEAESPASGLHFIDPDTAMNPHSLSAARHAAGAAVLATDLVVRGECRSAFCAVRPPGHHAEQNRAMGFCLFNNVAVAAGSGSAEFRDVVREHWLPALERHRPEIIYVSAGFDAHREDPLAGLKLTEADYAWVTREIVTMAARHGRGRIVSTLEGGYALSALGRSAAEHVRELLVAG